MPTPADEDFFHVAALGDQLVVSAEDTGLFVTADGGVSYRRIGLSAADVHGLAVVSGGTSLLAGTTYSTLSAQLPERTVNQDWCITADQSAIGQRVVSLSVAPDGSVYSIGANAFSRVNIERSTDGGVTWTTVEGVRTSSRGFQVLATGDHVYVTISDGQSPGVLVSRDGGQTWRKNDWPLLVTAIAADPTDPERIWLGGPSGLYRSDDEGRTPPAERSAGVTQIGLEPTRFLGDYGYVATSHAAAGWAGVARRSQPSARRRHRFSLGQLRAMRRILGVAVIVEVAILGARLLNMAGFNGRLTAAAMTLLAANLLASWLIIARANRGRRQRRYRHSRA